MTSLPFLKAQNERKSFCAAVRAHLEVGELTYMQAHVLMSFAVLGFDFKRSYAALSRWSHVSRATIGRVLAVGERLGLLTRHSKRRKLWDGERIRIVRDIITVRLRRFSSSSQNEPESDSFVSLWSLIAPNVPIDGPLGEALRRLGRAIGQREPA